MITIERADPQMAKKSLLRAAEILELGWCQRHFCAPQEDSKFGLELTEGQVGVDRFCIQGAIIKAVGELMGYELEQRRGGGYWHPETKMAHQAVEDILLKEQVMPLTKDFKDSGSAGWNDFVCTSGEEAAGVCRRAAEAL